jgi:hypothetical protein
MLQGGTGALTNAIQGVLMAGEPSSRPTPCCTTQLQQDGQRLVNHQQEQTLVPSKGWAC